jgi:hypothetical protein
MILNLGVHDIPYDDGTKTTGRVAEELETDYGIMAYFMDNHGQEVADDTVMAYLTMLETGLADQPLSETPALFRAFLSAKEMDGSKGVPTKRSLMGYSSRMKKATGVPRPSFIDTGAYSESFTAWLVK